jgi:hypothetical protein
LQTLTQVASQSAEARKALLEQVRENKLSQYDWATIVPFLAGDQMVFQNAAYENNIGLANPNNLRKSFLPAGNQSFYAAASKCIDVRSDRATEISDR